jgi:hypothetical protein
MDGMREPASAESGSDGRFSDHRRSRHWISGDAQGNRQHQAADTIAGKVFSQQIWLKLIKALLSEAQFNPELAEAFRERWILPRRLLICCTPRSTIACRLGLGPSTKSIQTEFLSR